MDTKKNKKTLRAALIASIPVMTGYIVMGTAFGIMLADKGYNALWALGMSITMYAGSMQFVAVDILSRGASLISAAIMTLLVNARHIVYGISMLGKYRKIGKIKPYLIFALTDETYALLSAEVPDNLNEKLYYFAVSLLDQLYWIIGCVFGALLGSKLTINTNGIDFAMTALFIVIFMEQWLSTGDYVPAILGVVITLVCLVVLGSENFLIPAMILIVICLSVYGRFTDKKAAGEGGRDGEEENETLDA